ncbi:MAG: tetratricopeptide repeat protein [Verrucomicrobia bacterium]|nr:tetratricopeptide repeat protein [Verrucomicrobiota bacterium]
MKTGKGKKGWVLAAVIVAAACVAFGVWKSGRWQNTPANNRTVTAAPADAGFTGSRTCRDCHEKFYKLWSTSHHGLAMQPFTAELARKELQPQKEDLVIRGVRYRAVIEGGQNHVLERGPQGERKYSIVHVMGGKNVYYFLGPLDRGRLQVLPVAYDVRRKQWYDTTASAMRHFHENPDEALDWRERPLTFNTSCFNCHVSQLEKNYNPHSDSYHTTWIEPGINCETCHGPCGEHVKLFKQLGPAGAEHPPKDVKLIKMTTMAPVPRSDTCAPCHAKMVPLTTTFQPGDRYFDHFDLGALEDRDFYPDGRDLGENYTFTLWKLNPCAKNGKFDCVHCHTSSGRDRFAGEKANNACLPCHKTHVENPAAHSHHAAGSEGGKCVACHMPMTEFARMRRSDHSMRAPAPAATLAFKSPNACNLCHADKDAAWADGFVRKWYPRDYQAPIIRLGRLVDAARKRDWSKLPEILDYIANKDREEVYAGSLVRLLEFCDNEAKWPAIVKALKNDPSPWIRARAAEALQSRLDSDTVPALVAATRDDTRLVRIRAASSLASYPADYLEPADRESVKRAAAEFEAHLKSRPDDGASFYNLGNFHMARREYEQAIACFETANKLQADLFAAHVNAALAYNAAGRNDKAEAALRQAIKLDATNAVANLNLGLLLGELGRAREAEGAFRTALKSEPRNAVAAYNLAVIAGQDGRVDEAITLCGKAAEAAPQEPKYAYTLAFYQRQKGLTNDAVRTLRRLLAGRPAYGAAYALLGEICEQQGDRSGAAEVYRQAAENRRLSEQERAQFAQRLQSF